MLLNAHSLCRFGSFELDMVARVLTRDGSPVLLARKDLEVLSFLVANAPRVVTKEEIIQAVWPESFVEENNLTQHISALRKALGDKAGYIVTFPARGYQFSVDVEVEHPVNELPESRPGDVYIQRVSERTQVVLEETSPASTSLPSPTAVTPRQARLGWLIAGSLVATALISLAALLGWKHFARTPRLSQVVLAGFTNTTGDPSFDDTLSQALEIDLAQSPFVDLLPRSKVRETLTLMQRKPDDALTPDLAREICERNNAQAVLHGMIAGLGKKYLLTLTADSCVNGKRVAAFKAEADSKEQVLSALDKMSGRVRSQLGESADSLERFQIPVEQATTSSLEALRVYSQAQESLDRIEPRAALELYQRAVALDPKFASAYFGLGASYYRLSDHSQAALYIKKAFDLRTGTTERERLNIEIAYHYFGDYDTEAALRSLKLFIATYPKSSAKSWANLCGLYTQLGDYAQAITAGEQALRLDSHSALRSEILSRAYKRANRFADAKRVAGAAAAMNYPSWGLHSILFQVAFAERDKAALKAETEWELSHPQRDRTFSDLAFAAATSGRLREAMEYFSRAQAEAVHEGDTGFAQVVLEEKSEVLIEFGEAAQSRALLKQLSGKSEDDADVVFLQAKAGDIAPAQRYVAATNPLAEKNTIHLYFDLPLVRAQLAIQAHKPLEAIQQLEPARPYQLRDYSVPSLRAQAEAEAGLLDAAAGDYRLILNNQGVDPISPLYPMAHLGLARVLALQKKPEEARYEYRSFLDSWRDADAGLRLVQSARSEFNRLQ